MEEHQFCPPYMTVEYSSTARPLKVNCALNYERASYVSRARSADRLVRVNHAKSRNCYLSLAKPSFYTDSRCFENRSNSSSLDNPAVCDQCDCFESSVGHRLYRSSELDLSSPTHDQLYANAKERRATLTRHNAIHLSDSDSSEEPHVQRPLQSIYDFMPSPKEESSLSDESDDDIPYMTR